MQATDSMPLTPGSAWKSFVSPSLFSTGLDSPNGFNTSTGIQTPTGNARPTSMMHEREINPFNDAFSISQSNLLSSSDGPVDLGQIITRKRAIHYSQQQSTTTGDDMMLQDMKRPRLTFDHRLDTTDSSCSPRRDGSPHGAAHKDDDGEEEEDEDEEDEKNGATTLKVPVPSRTDSTTTSSELSGPPGNSFQFEEAGSSNESTGKPATDSPASSVAPSPKPTNGMLDSQEQRQPVPQPHQYQSQQAQQSAFHHFQPAPLPMRFNNNTQQQPQQQQQQRRHDRRSSIHIGPSAEYYDTSIKLPPSTIAPSATLPSTFAPMGTMDPSSATTSQSLAYDMTSSAVAAATYPHNMSTIHHLPISNSIDLSHQQQHVHDPQQIVHMPISKPSSTSAVNVRAPVNGPSTFHHTVHREIAATNTAGSSPASTTADINTPAPHNNKMDLSQQQGPRKRGRKPKIPDPNANLIDPEIEKAAALERNRIAASKSRLRKKERVHNLESTAAELSQANSALQATCHALQQELASLRQLLSQTHPSSTCTCTHVQGFLTREAQGGGIATIERLAGDTLHRSYSTTSIEPLQQVKLEQENSMNMGVPDMSIKETAVMAQLQAQSQLAAQQAVAVHHRHQQQQQQQAQHDQSTSVANTKPKARRGRSASQQQTLSQQSQLILPPRPGSPITLMGQNDVEKQNNIIRNAIPIRSRSNRA
ncbi:hypothetical protein OIO90_004260 [Microbotryomycetes sp. JL221]|nr:hypothetical protein OIO90_004260 [Microbotryomycetes sp. JL221]